MDNLFRLMTRVLLLMVGTFFFLFMLFVGAVSVILMMIRMLWLRLTGKKSENNFNVKFWTFSEKNPPRQSQRELEDVTDVEVKEVVQPEDYDHSGR